ncbi:hypothetical protein F5H01DRAFT_417115 [Linnemannia elongata]|nr:hypothetical protein F5H01DRAFT_417115 [Linnemannia elongata]
MECVGSNEDEESWAKERGIDPGQPNLAQQLNWFTAGVLVHDWHASTVQNYKSAIVYMHDDKLPFSYPYFLSYFKAMKERSIKDMKEIDIDLQPILSHFRLQGPKETLSTSALTKTLCGLLGTCGFLRPSVANSELSLSEDQRKLPITFPRRRATDNRSSSTQPSRSIRIRSFALYVPIPSTYAV